MFKAKRPIASTGSRRVERLLSRKVSDEYDVLFFAIHHGALHMVSDEKAWWQGQSIVLKRLNTV